MRTESIAEGRDRSFLRCPSGRTEILPSFFRREDDQMNCLWLLSILTVTAHAADLTVWTTGDTFFPNHIRFAAKTQVSRIYAQIGVYVAWDRNASAVRASPGSGRPVRAKFETGLFPSVDPGVLAFSQPFDAIPTITVLCDRIALVTEERPFLRVALLAHVLAHEIGHVLESSTSHAATGLMKAHWNEADYLHMEKDFLPFDPLDLERIGACLGAVRVRAQISRGPIDGLTTSFEKIR